jgi:hypothetical protein
MSDYDIGDVARTRVTVRDSAGVLTNATVAHTYQRPDLTTGVGSVVNDGTGLYHADIALTTAGEWRWDFDITGAVTGSESGALYVRVDWSAPVPWVPSLRQVADYVPTRTVPVDTPGSMVPLGTFSSTTVPTDEVVDRIARAAAAWVSSRAGVVDAGLYEMAGAVAAVRAAAFVELAYPTRDGDAAVYEELFKQADAGLAALIVANGAAGGTPPGDGLLPYWSFPDPAFDSDTYPVSW